MNHKASVSVIIPCYNAEKTVGRAIESILAQSLLPHEIIIVDDKSADSSCRIVKDYAKQYTEKIKITLIELAQNSGPAKARNVGWDNAEADYIAFLDSDDSWHPQKIELQYSYMREYPDVMLSGHLYEVLSDKKIPVTMQKIENTEVISRIKLLLRNRFSTSAVMLKRSVPIRFREFKKYSEDYRLWLEIVFNNYKAILLYSNLCYYYKYRYGSSGLSSKMLDMWFGELDNYKALYKNRDIGIFEYVFVLILSFLKFFKGSMKNRVGSLFK